MTIAPTPAAITPYFHQSAEPFLDQLSRQLLRLPEIADEWLAAKQAKQPAGLADLINQRIHWLIKKTGGWDVSTFPKAVIPGLNHLTGPISLAQAPVTVFAAWLYLFTFPVRMQIAKKREQPDDLTKESFDVALRDMTSFALLLFVLDPVVRWLNQRVFQKSAGLPLVKGGHVVNYSEMRKILSIESPNQLAALLDNPDTRTGLLKATQELGDRGLSQLGFFELKHRIVEFKTLIQQLTQPSAQNNQPLVEQAFEKLTSLDELVNKAKQFGVATQNKQLVSKAFNISETYRYPQFLSYYANRFKVPADLMSVLAVLLLAGWLPLALSNLFSLRAVKQYLKNGQIPQQSHHKNRAKIDHNNPVFESFKGFRG